MSDYLDFVNSNVQTFGHETSWPKRLLGLSLWLLSLLKFNFVEELASFIHQSDSDSILHQSEQFKQWPVRTLF
jgi:hypothetical protein